MKNQGTHYYQSRKRYKKDIYWFWSVTFCFLFLQSIQMFSRPPGTKERGYIHRAWQIKDGLPQNYINNIVQTRDGYIWLGTIDGIIRFDGIKFDIFKDENTPEIKANYVLALLADRAGSLWISTQGGGLLRFKAGKFTNYRLNLGVPDDGVSTLCEGRDGSIWIGTMGGRVIRLKDGKLTFLNPEGIFNTGAVNSLYEDREETLWIGTCQKGLVRWGEGAVKIYNKRNELASNKVSSICEDGEGNLWIGTDCGLNQLKKGKLKTFTTKDGLTNNYVCSIYEDRSGGIWIGTYGGLNRWIGGKLINFTSEKGVLNTNVLSIFEDAEGNLWIGMWGGGLFQVKHSKFKTYTTREGLPGDTVYPIFGDDNGTMWLGIREKGLIQWKNNQFKTYSIKDGLSGEFVFSMYEDRRENLWIGTLGGGLNKFKDNKFTVYTTKHGLSSNYILSLYGSRDGSLWIGTNNGLDRFKDGIFTHYTITDGVPGKWVRSIYEDTKGNLWIATEPGGIAQIRWNSENSKVIFKTYDTKEVLSDKAIFNIYEDKEKKLWLVTFGAGLIRFNDGTFKAYTTKEGLFSNIIFQALEDEMGNFWMSSNKGIFRVSKQDINDFDEGKRQSIPCVSYGEEDGMETSKCSGGCQPAGWKTRDGKLWFPTVKGVVMIEPGRFETSAFLPPVIIEKVKIDDDVMAPIQDIELSPGMRRLEFHFTAPGFTAPKKIKFKYRLEGFDEKWIEAGSSTDRRACYTNIPPGYYCFRVKACNHDGIWNETGASWNFHLNPFFYQTNWFYGICVICILAIGTGIHWLRVRQVLIKERKKYEKVRLSAECEKEYLNKILHFIESEKVYLESDINLHKLSKRLMIPHYYISQVLNRTLKRNYFDLINHYRIEEAKRILTDSKNHLSILEIAFEVGYNSKSTFNRAFKKHTNMTPTDFKKSETSSKSNIPIFQQSIIPINCEE